MAEHAQTLAASPNPDLYPNGTPSPTPIAQPVAIVTGASSGIGLCIAQHLAEQGYYVYGCARRFALAGPADIGSRGDVDAVKIGVEVEVEVDAPSLPAVGMASAPAETENGSETSSRAANVAHLGAGAAADDANTFSAPAPAPAPAPCTTFTRVPLDVTDDTSLVEFIARVLSERGRIDILINNAGFSLWGSVEDVPPPAAQRQLAVNLRTVGRLSQLVLPTMRAQRSGRIINMSSASGEVWTPLSAWYTASKFALEGFSNALRVEAAPWGVHVVVIQPALTRSEGPGIAARGLMEVSGEGAWGEWAKRSAERLKEGEAREDWDAPEHVARVVWAAIKADRPRTRYAVGWSAWAVLLVRRWVPDRWYDCLSLMAFGCRNQQVAEGGKGLNI